MVLKKELRGKFAHAIAYETHADFPVGNRLPSLRRVGIIRRWFKSGYDFLGR
jgi:hypothetical protein